MRYVNEFLSLKCAPDVLIATNSPKIKKLPKEISEVMSAWKYVRRIINSTDIQWRIFDICAGNGLFGVLAAHLSSPSNVSRIIAIDKRDRKLESPVKNYYRLCEDIYMSTKLNHMVTHNIEPTIFVAIHPCNGLAKRVIELYKEYKGKKVLVIMPCCGKAKQTILPPVITEDMYKKWCYELYTSLDDPRMYQDTNNLSPRNIIITERKY